MSNTESGNGTALNEDTPNENEMPPVVEPLVRTSLPFEILRSADDGMPVLHGRGAVYGEWTEINSRVEGHFMERFTPGAFTKTIADQGSRIRCLFNHGQDPSIGMKPLGPITDLSERNDGVHYEVKLLDTPYNRDLVPGLQAGLYGSSFRFGIVRKDDVNARRSTSGLLERTISEATMRELGPTPFPAYGSTSAGIRSLTDEFVLGRFPAEQLAAAAAKHEEADRDLISEMTYLANKFSESQETDLDAVRDLMAALASLSGTDPAPSEDAAPSEGTSLRNAAKPTNAPLWGTREKPSWHL